MAVGFRSSPRLARVADVIALALLYAASERLRLLFPLTEGPGWLWLPSGVALGVLLLRGRDRWPGVALGAFGVSVLTSGSVGIALAGACHATAEALVAATLVGYTHRFDPGLGSVGDVLHLLLASVAGAAVAATIGAPTLLLTGNAHADPGTTWLIFFMGDLVGILLVVPAMLVWRRAERARHDRGEFALLLLATFAIGLLMFESRWLPTGFLSFPLIVWGAFHFGQQGVTGVTALLTALALLGSALGLGPFATATGETEALMVSGFILVVSVTALIMAALVEERERARAGLLASEARFGAFMRHSPALAFMKSTSGEYLFGNDAWADQFGQAAPALLGRTDADLWPADTARAFTASDQRVLETGRPLDVTESGHSPGGEVRWWKTFKFPILQPDQPPLIAGIAMDITEAQRVEQALRESERRYRSLIDLAGSVIVVLDRDGRTAEFNREAESFFGVSREAALGRDFVQVCVPEASREQMRHELTRVRSAEAVRDCEVTFQAPDGTRRALAWNGSRLLDTQDRLSGVLFTGQDISELRRLETQLLLSQRMEGIGRLAGGIAHDFNNLLTAILGHAEMARDDVGPGQVAQSNIAEITRAAQRAADLTRQLLAFARRQIIEPRIVDLNALVLTVDRMLRRVLGEDVELVTLPGSDLWRVRIDPGQFEQVLVNLAVNARDAMPDGGTLLIETRNVYLDAEYARHHTTVIPGPHVLLAVSDAGTGMDAGVLAHIFEPFFTTKEVGKGTGLGLATCYGIVKQNKGSIWVYSEPGRGTTFKIYLPRADGAVLPERDVQALRTEPSTRGTETVLLVEDEALVRNLAADALRRQGYQVLVAATGSEAIALASQLVQPVDVLVTDVVMPQMGGPQLASRLAAGQPSMKVLFISGYTDNALIHQGVLVPGMTLLQKPFTPGQLARRVRELIDSGGGPAQPRLPLHQ